MMDTIGSYPDAAVVNLCVDVLVGIRLQKYVVDFERFNGRCGVADERLSPCSPRSKLAYLKIAQGVVRAALDLQTGEH